MRCGGRRYAPAPRAAASRTLRRTRSRSSACTRCPAPPPRPRLLATLASEIEVLVRRSVLPRREHARGDVTYNVCSLSLKIVAVRYVPTTYCMTYNCITTNLVRAVCVANCSLKSQVVVSQYSVVSTIADWTTGHWVIGPLLPGGGHTSTEVCHLLPPAEAPGGMLSCLLNCPSPSRAEWT